MKKLLAIAFLLLGASVAQAQPTGKLNAGQVWGNPGASAALASPTNIGALIDQFFTCSAQGDILYRGSSAWTCLAPGTAGLPITSQGAGANLTYGVLGLSAGGTSKTTAAAARASAGLNVEAFTGHGDSIYTILVTDKVVGTNAAFTASRTWTLPAANAVNPGQPLVVSDFAGGVTASNTLVISRAGSDTINGGTSVTISAANGAYLLWSDGTSKWTAQAVGSTVVSGVSSVGGQTGAIGVTNGIDMSGANIELTAARRTLPTSQKLTSSSGTYTTPANTLWIEVIMVGGGAGGSGGNNTGPSAAAATCWNTSGAACTSPVSSAGGGGAGNAAIGGSGGSASGTCDWSANGSSGSAGSSATASTNAGGGTGGASFFGGAGGGGTSGGANAATNSGGGGGGGGEAAGTAASSGGGGGSGAVCHFIINTPAGTYTYAVGTGTSGSAGGTGGGAGGNGAAGQIYVVEHYGT